jgi:integrase
VAESSSRHRGRHGDGTIYTTKDGRLRAEVTVPTPDRRAVRRYLSARTDAEIKRKLKDARAERATVGHTPTVATWAERWLALVAHRVRPATLAVYRVALRRHVIPTLGSVELARLRPSGVEGMTSGMIEAGSAPSTAALARRVLVVCLTDAARDGLIVRNVAQLARAPRTAEPFRRALSADEVRAFLAAVASDPLGPLVARTRHRAPPRRAPGPALVGRRRGGRHAHRVEGAGCSAAGATRSPSRSHDGRGGRSPSRPSPAMPSAGRPKRRQERRPPGRPGRPRQPRLRGSDRPALAPGVGHERVAGAGAPDRDRPACLHDLRHTAAT